MSLENPDESTRCEKCGTHVFLPVVCRSCHKSFCDAHSTNHGDQCVARRVLNDASQMSTGVTLDELVASVMERERVEAEMAKKAMDEEKEKLSHGSDPTMDQRRQALLQRHQQQPSALLTNSLPLGLHRNRRLEVGLNLSGEGCRATVVVFFYYHHHKPSALSVSPTSPVSDNAIIINNEASVPAAAAAAARRDREHNDNDSDDNVVAPLVVLRPMWMDVAKGVSIGALLETVCRLLERNYLSKSGTGAEAVPGWFCELTGAVAQQVKKTQPKRQQQVYVATPLLSVASKGDQQQEQQAGVLLQHVKTLLLHRLKEGFDAQRVTSLVPSSHDEKEEGNTSSSSGSSNNKQRSHSCAVKSVTSLSASFEAIPATVLAVDIGDYVAPSKPSLLPEEACDELWQHHSMWMLPFARRPTGVASQTKQEEQQHAKGGDDDSSPNSKNSHNQPSVTSPPAVASNALQSVPWAPNNDRAKPLLVGMQTTPTAPAIPVVCFALGKDGKLAQGSFGWTLKVNQTFIVGRVLDALLDARGFLPASLKPFGDNNLRLVKMIVNTTDAASSSSSSSSSCALDLSLPLSKQVQSSNPAVPAVIAIAPADGAEPDPALLMEAKTFAEEMKTRKLSKPLMVRSMKECCVQ